MLFDRAAKCVINSNTCGSQIVYARIRFTPCNLFVIAVYMPHAGRKVKPFAADIRKQLEEVLLQVNQYECVILLGDLNCKLGRNRDKLTGKWCVHKYANKRAN